MKWLVFYRAGSLSILLIPSKFIIRMSVRIKSEISIKRPPMFLDELMTFFSSTTALSMTFQFLPSHILPDITASYASSLKAPLFETLNTT